MLEWKPEPGSKQGGSVQHYNHLVFVQHNEQGNGKRTARIYNNITCYKCDQLGHYSGSYPFKEEEQKKLKEKESSPEKVVQGINCATVVISSMNVDHEADESNGETEYNSDSDSDSDNEDKNDDESEPTPGV